MKPELALRGLPRHPELDAATRLLFAAIRTGDAEAVRNAIRGGGRLDAVEPYRVDGGEIAGGGTALQTACLCQPGRRIAMEVLDVLLEAGADPNTGAPDQGLPARIVAERLPTNAKQAIGRLVTAGAQVDAGMVAAALLAEHMWVNPSPVFHAISVADALWEALPENERSLLDPHLPVQLVGVRGQGLHPQWLARAKWVLAHLPVAPAVSMEEETRPARPPRRTGLH